MEHGQREGHLFIIDGDLNKIRSDAVLVPTSAGYYVRPIWNRLLKAGWEDRVDWSTLRWTVNPDPVTLGSDQQVWFANVGSIADEPDPYIDVARDFVAQASRALADRDRGRQTARPPLLALNALGTGDGGMSEKRGQLIRLLVAALTSAVTEHGVDVVLVTWGTKQYAAARRAQRLLRSMSSLSRVPAQILHEPVVYDTVRRLASEALLQRLVLFVGAGVGRGAGLPDWDRLILDMAAAAGEAIDTERLQVMDSRDQAQVLMAHFGSEVYRDMIVRAVSSDKYGLSHGLLASLDPHEVVTTNYDTLLEDAFGEARTPAVLPQHAVGTDGRWILKLHGTVKQPETIVLARQDYLGLPERSAALFGILQAMMMTKHMLFVGYSLTDDTFHRVMHDVRRARGETGGKIGTALTLFDDPMLRKLWGDVLEFVPMEPRPTVVTEVDVARAARKLEIVLDEIAIHSADISAFLLDPTYDGVLDHNERNIRREAAQLLLATEGDEHIGAAVREMLGSLTRDDPKDEYGSAEIRQLALETWKPVDERDWHQ